MRILFCTLDYPPSEAGGAEQQAQHQAEELTRRGHAVDVVCGRRSTSSSGHEGSVMVYRLPFPARAPYIVGMLVYLAVLAGFLSLRLRRYDLVHVHLANLQADVAVAMARILGRPSYVKVAQGGPHGEIGRLRKVARLTRFFGLRHADAVQALSAEITRDLASIGVPPQRIHRIPNGLPDERPRIHATAAEARRALGIEANAVIALYVGRMEEEKGVHELLQAWRRRTPADARLLLVGTPGRKDPVPLDSLPPAVEYRGWTDRPAEYMEAADIFVLPSHAEGMSNALLEAMAAGLAVISTPVGASPEVVRDGESGILVDVGDVEGLAHAINDLAVDPELRGRLGERARETVCERYTIAAVVDAIEPVYRSITRQ